VALLELAAVEQQPAANSPSSSPLRVQNVVKSYRQGEESVRALRGVSLEVRSGQLLAIMGASGSGKSTLLHLMAGLTVADEGQVIVNGQDIGGMKDRELTLFRRHQIGLVFQAFNLIPTLTAEENILLPLMLEGGALNGRANRLDDLLRSLGIATRRHHRPDAMSGGEQQRVAIGRALVTNPAVVLADEPTGNLDSTNSRSVCELLQNLCRNEGKTIVMVTHEPSVAAYADEVAVLKDGQLVARFATESIGGAEKLSAQYQEAIR
jgi:putative ABC transport system ATP-binding protein